MKGNLLDKNVINQANPPNLKAFKAKQCLNLCYVPLYFNLFEVFSKSSQETTGVYCALTLVILKI